ncbi:hypothetical protein BC941DRAFT_465628 [Chlamydoabsidia padenii]|nr:hypothetical protein BC941DRAFT_465628 [Chlamydoabsidia padenii]
MDRSKKEIEQFVEKAEKAHSDNERRQYNDDANQVHEKVTGHPMKFDSNGHLDKTSPDAKKCPALQ